MLKENQLILIAGQMNHINLAMMDYNNGKTLPHNTAVFSGLEIETSD